MHMCIDKCIRMCTTKSMCMCMHMCTDMRMDMCVDMCVAMQDDSLDAANHVQLRDALALDNERRVPAVHDGLRHAQLAEHCEPALPKRVVRRPELLDQPPEIVVLYLSVGPFFEVYRREQELLQTPERGR